MKRSEPDARPLIGLPLTRAAAVLVLVAPLGLSACSFLDPGDPETAGAARGPAAASEPKGFPSLGSVPRRAPRTSSSAERQRVAQGLAAARRTAGSRLPRLDRRPRAGASTAAPPPPPAVPRARTAPPASAPRPVVASGNGSPRAGDRAAMTEAPPAAPPTGTAAAPRVAALASVGPERQAFTQAFAQALAQSASAAAATPPDTSFAAPAAAPLTAGQTPVPDVVRTAYNEPLAAASGSPVVAPGADASATVHFANGSARLNGEAKAIVRGVAEAWKAQGGAVRVVGHASRPAAANPATRRHKLVNFGISLDRATAVANELIRLGVDRSAVRIAAVGDSRPVFDESMPEGEAGNRRAEIFHSFQ